MWWVLAETVDVYVCRGIVWYRVPGRAPMALRMPPTLPLLGQLQRVSEAMRPLLKRRAKFRIALGAKLCPPVCFDVPPGFRWQEQQWIAQKKAAQVWGVNPAEAHQLVCELSVSVKGLAAALPKATLDALRVWLSGHQETLVSVAPMWANLGYPSGLSQLNVGSCTLAEPDGTRTTLHKVETGCSVAFADAADDAAITHDLFRWSEDAVVSRSSDKRRWSWCSGFERVNA